MLSNTKNKVYKELLLEYFAEFIPKNVERWNEYKKALPDLEINLSNRELHKVDLSQINLKKANLRNLLLYESNFFQTNLSKVNLENTTIVSQNIKQSSLEGAFFSGTQFYDVELDRVDFRNSNVNYINFVRGISIVNIVFDSSIELDEVNFGESPEFQNVIFKNGNLQEGYFSDSSFDNIIFNNCNLKAANFSYCINFANKLIFKESNLENIDFKFSNLKGVRFDRVNLRGADFRWSNLTGVDFTGLDVRGANFTRCTFGNNNLDKANTEGAKFSSVDSPRFPPLDLNTSKLKGALFDDQHYYEPGAE